MNPIWTQIIIQTTLQNKGKKTSDKKYSDFELAKGYRELLITTKRQLKDFVLIAIGIFSAAFGFKGFLLTNHFIDGGATGIALLISALTEIPLYILIICVNIPFVGCQCTGPYTTNLPIQIKQTHIAPPNNFTTNFDDAPASTGPSHIELYNLSVYPFYNNLISGQGYASFDPKFHGFTPVASALDLHNPANGSPASIFSRVDNVPTGLNLLNINNLNNALTQHPQRRFGFPYLAYPTNHYQVTPFDAVFVIGTNNGTDVNNNPRPDNQYHNEDPQEFIGDYLARTEVAPTELFLSNQTIGITASAFSGYTGGYKAEFEARDKIIAGNTDNAGNNIYSLYNNQNYLTPNGDLKVAVGSTAIMHSGNLVEFLPGFEVPLGAQLDAFIQSYNCGDLLFRVNNNTPNGNNNTETKHNLPDLGFNYDEPLNKISDKKINSFLLYPNPNNGSFTYVNVCDGEPTSFLIISDLSGKTVYNETIYNNSPLDLNLNQLHNGLYLVKVINKNSTDNFKLTIYK